MKKNVIYLMICFKVLIANASVESLFLQSLEQSKLIEIINLEEKKSLLELKYRTSTVFPEISLNNYNKYGDETYQSYDGLKKINSSVALTLDQKLFQGGSEFAIYDLKKIVPESVSAKKDLELSSYFAEFSKYYFEFSAAIEERDTVKHLLNNLEKRVQIVKRRTKIGRDRNADLLALESQLARLKSDLYSTEIQIDQARINFINFSNLKDVQIVKDEIDPLKLILNKKVDLELRPELRSLRSELKTSKAEVRIQKSHNFPQVSLSSNYHVEKNYTEKNNWDVSLNVKLPLIDFGRNSTSTQAKQVQAMISQARLDYSYRNSKNIWNNYLKSFELKKSELTSLKNALKKSKDSYKEQLKDLEKGLITQIDVIRSLDDVINLEKLLIKSTLDLKRFFYQANAYLGNFPKK